MKKRLFFAMVLATMALGTMAQTPQFTETDSSYKPVDYVMDSLFSQLDLSGITSGYLLDKGVATANVAMYHGQTDADSLHYPEAWWAVYGSLYRSALNSPTLSHPDVMREAVKAAMGEDGIPIMFMHHQFHQAVTDSVLLSQLITWDGSYFQDVPNRPQSPWVAHEAFVVAPFQLALTDQLSATFILPSSLVVGNGGKTIQYLEINFDDGNGWSSFSLNETLAVTWPTDGNKYIQVRATFTDATVYTSTCLFKLKTTPPTYKLANGAEGYDAVPDREVQIFSGHGQNLGATLQIEYGCGNSALAKPFIWVEGYNPPEFGVYDYTENFWITLNNYQISNLSWNAANINEILQSNGYDIVYIDFDHGAADMHENAKVVMAALEWVNAEKAKNYSASQNVIWGESMGGVLAHMALSQMEAAGKTHDCKYYISFDAPHLGANVPLGFQHMIKHFQSMIINGTNLVNELPLGATVPNILNVYNHKATQQLLIYNAFSPSGIIHPEYVAMQQYLASLILPQQTEQNIAIANGNGTGTSQGYPTLAKMLNINFKNQQFANAVDVNDPTLSWLTGAALWWFTGTRINVQADVYAMPGHTSTFYRIFKGKAKVMVLGYEIIKVGYKEVKAANTYPFDNCPGGTQGVQNKVLSVINDINGVDLYHDRFAFVPTVSALGISSELTNPFYQIGTEQQVVNQSKTAFDDVHVFNHTDYTATASNEAHVRLTPSNADVFADWLNDVLYVFDNEINNAPHEVDGDVYNMSANESTKQATTDRINISLMVKGNAITEGILCINCSGKIGYQSTPINPVSDIPYFNASFGNACEMFTNSLTVDDGGILQVGENDAKTGIFNIRTGNFILKSGGRLVVNENSKLVIHNGANFIFEDGATIELLGPNAELIIKGKVTVGDNATLTFSGEGHMVIDQLIYDGVYDNFWDIGQNAKLKLDGWPTRGTVLECKSNFVPKMQNQHTFSEIEIRTGDILMHPNTQISTHAPLNMYLVTMNRAGTSGRHNGLALWGQQATIRQCTFKHANVAITAEQATAIQALDIQASDFEDNIIGLVTRGKNAHVTASRFVNNANGGWEANQMSGTSRLENCTLDNPGGIAGVYFEGQQSATLVAEGNTFRNSETGIRVETATLTPTCNTFTDLTWEGVLAIESSVFLNEEKYNLFNNNTSGITISNGDGDIFFIEQGYNEFKLGNAGINHINGTFLQGAILNLPTANTLDADNNSMETITIGSFTGAPVDIDYYPQPFTSFALTLHIPNNLATINANCGGNGGIGVVLEEALTIQQLSSFKTLQTNLYNGVNLQVALLDALSHVSTDVEEVDDLIAIEKLYEILTYNLGSTTTDEDAMLEIGYKVLIKALNYSFYYGNLQLNRAEPNPNVDTYTGKVVSVINHRLGVLNPVAITYQSELFRLNLDKAHVYRLGEYFDQAIDQLNNYTNWATQTHHINRVNYWLCICQAERSLLLEEISFEDFAIETQNCQSLWVAKHDASIHRKIGQNVSKNNDGTNLVRAFPNPAKSFIDIQWFGDKNNISVELLNLNGQVLLQQSSNGNTAFRIQLPNGLAQGVYLLRVSGADEHQTVKISIMR